MEILQFSETKRILERAWHVISPQEVKYRSERCTFFHPHFYVIFYFVEIPFRFTFRFNFRAFDNFRRVAQRTEISETVTRGVFARRNIGTFSEKIGEISETVDARHLHKQRKMGEDEREREMRAFVVAIRGAACERRRRGGLKMARNVNAAAIQMLRGFDLHNEQYN